MSNEKIYKTLHTVYLVGISVSLVALAVLLVTSCIDLYRSGPSPFTRDSVAQALALPTWFMALVLVYAIAGHFLFPAPEGENKRLRGTTSTADTLKKLSAKVDMTKCSREIQRRLHFERTLRASLTAVIAVAYVAGGIVALIFSTNEARFPAEDPNGEVMRGVLTVLLCLVLPFALSVAALFVNQASRRRELTIIKAAMREAAGKPMQAQGRGAASCAVCTFMQRHHDSILLTVRIVVLIAGIALLVLGTLNGGARDVVQKAIKICRECIGLG